MSRKGKVIIAILAALTLLALLAVAASRNNRGDLFAPIKPYTYRDRSAILDVSSPGASFMYPGGKYLIRGIHVRGLTVRQTDNLLFKRLTDEGYRRIDINNQDAIYQPAVTGREEQIEIAAGAPYTLDGVIVGHVKPAKPSDLWWLRIKGLGKKTVVNLDQATDVKKFLGE